MKKPFKNGKYFKLQEFLYSATATRLNIKLEPNEEQLENMENLIYFCLDPLRIYYGKAIVITSGFRNEKLNKAVGGSPNSQHMKGQAADIAPSPGNRVEGNYQILFKLAQKLDFDQLILERKWNSANGYVSTWIHISYNKDGNRRQVIENMIVNPKQFPQDKLKLYPKKSYVLPKLQHKTREEEIKNEEETITEIRRNNKDSK